MIVGDRMTAPLLFFVLRDVVELRSSDLYFDANERAVSRMYAIQTTMTISCQTHQHAFPLASLKHQNLLLTNRHSKSLSLHLALTRRLILTMRLPRPITHTEERAGATRARIVSATATVPLSRQSS